MGRKSDFYITEDTDSCKQLASQVSQTVNVTSRLRLFADLHAAPSAASKVHSPLVRLGLDRFFLRRSRKDLVA